MKLTVSDILTGALDSGVPRVDLFPEDLQKELGSCNTRITKALEGVGEYFEQEILYRGKWRKVGRTSLYDDVATGFCARTEDDVLTIKKLTEMKNYGARVHPSYLLIVTCMSDG